jgi:hypothetical protein
MCTKVSIIWENNRLFIFAITFTIFLSIFVKIIFSKSEYKFSRNVAKMRKRKHSFQPMQNKSCYPKRRNGLLGLMRKGEAYGTTDFWNNPFKVNFLRKKISGIS